MKERYKPQKLFIQFASLTSFTFFVIYDALSYTNNTISFLHSYLCPDHNSLVIAVVFLEHFALFTNKMLAIRKAISTVPFIPGELYHEKDLVIGKQ